MRSGEFSTVSGSLCEKQGPKFSAIFLTALITDCDLISSVVVFERRFVDVSERRCDSFAPVVGFDARGLFGGRAAGTGRDGTLYAVTRSISVKTEERPSRWNYFRCDRRGSAWIMLNSHLFGRVYRLFRDFVSSSSERLLGTSEHVTSFGPPCLLVWIKSYNLDVCAAGTRTTRVTQDRAWFKMYASLPHPIPCLYQSRRKSISVISHPRSQVTTVCYGSRVVDRSSPSTDVWTRICLHWHVWFLFWYNWTQMNCLNLMIKVVLLSPGKFPLYLTNADTKKQEMSVSAEQCSECVSVLMLDLFLFFFHCWKKNFMYSMTRFGTNGPDRLNKLISIWLKWLHAHCLLYSYKPELGSFYFLSFSRRSCPIIELLSGRTNVSV